MRIAVIVSISSIFTDSEHRNKHLGQGIEHNAHYSLPQERATINHHCAAEHAENC